MRSRDGKDRVISELFVSIITLLVAVIVGAASCFINPQTSASAQPYQAYKG